MRGNTIGGNGRYGIYIDTEGAFDLVDNVVIGSKAGLMVRGRESVDEDDDEWCGNTEDEVGPADPARIAGHVERSRRASIGTPASARRGA